MPRDLGGVSHAHASDNRLTDLGPICGPCSGPWICSSPFHLLYGTPWEHCLRPRHTDERGFVKVQGSREVPALSQSAKMCSDGLKSSDALTGGYSWRALKGCGSSNCIEDSIKKPSHESLGMPHSWISPTGPWAPPLLRVPHIHTCPRFMACSSCVLPTVVVRVSSGGQLLSMCRNLVQICRPEREHKLKLSHNLWRNKRQAVSTWLSTLQHQDNV